MDVDGGLFHAQYRVMEKLHLFSITLGIRVKNKKKMCIDLTRRPPNVNRIGALEASIRG